MRSFTLQISLSDTHTPNLAVNGHATEGALFISERLFMEIAAMSLTLSKHTL